MRAVGDLLIIKVIHSNKLGTSRFILPDAQGIKENISDYHAEVVSVGPQVTLDVKPGDKVIHRRNEGFKFLDGQDIYYSINQRWVEVKCEP